MQLCAATFAILLFTWNDAFHGYITGRRREGAMVTQRAVTVNSLFDPIRMRGISLLHHSVATSWARARDQSSSWLRMRGQ